MDKTITILGAGYVGLTTAALLAHAGYTVYALEPNKSRLDAIKQGRSFFYEEGIDPVIAAGIKNGTLIPTDSYKDSVSKSHIVFSAVGTPDNPDGSSNLTYVFAAAEEAAAYLQDGSLYIQKSTVPVGTGEKVEARFKELGKDIKYLSNPEFLREGAALRDTLYFDRVVIGGDNKDAVQEAIEIYENIEKVRDHIAHIAGIPTLDTTGEYIATTRNSAELIKVSANAFLALKISFANSIAKLADAADADVREVMDAVGADKRIGRAFLNAGRGYGGGCFPKDVSGLIESGRAFGVEQTIMQSVQAVNQSMPGYVIEKLQNLTGSKLAAQTVAILGLSFKAGTSDTRRSPGINLANLLTKQAKQVVAYDPQANEEAKETLDAAVMLHESLAEAVKDADAIVVATEWPDFSIITPSELRALTNAKTIVDAVNSLDKAAYLSAGFQYTGIGR